MAETDRTGRMRASITPTHDGRETGHRYVVETRVNDRTLPSTAIPDPFIFHRVTVGWPDLLRSLLRGKLEVVVCVGGDEEIVEDVLELNADYLGLKGSSRRRDWDEHVAGELGRIGSSS